jgi:hypothetical protein
MPWNRSDFLRTLNDGHGLKKMGVCSVCCVCGQVYSRHIGRSTETVLKRRLCLCHQCHFRRHIASTWTLLSFSKAATSFPQNLHILAKHQTAQGHIPEDSDFNIHHVYKIIFHISFLFHNNILASRLNNYYDIILYICILSHIAISLSFSLFLSVFCAACQCLKHFSVFSTLVTFKIFKFFKEL